MKCPSCGTENRKGARFCMTCGTQLVRSSDAPSAPHTTRPEKPSTLVTEPIRPSDSDVSTPEEVTSPAVVPEEEDLSEEMPFGTPTPEIQRPVASSEETRQDLIARIAQERIEIAEPPAPAEETSPEPQPTEPVGVTIPPAEDRLPPLEPGVLVAGRFEIVELLESDAGANLYSAHDLAICPRCHEERDLSDNKYCTECGFALELAGPPVLCKLQEALSPEAIGVNADDGVFHNGRFYLSLPEEEMLALPAVEPAFPCGMTLSVGYASDVGQRDLDEDSLCVFTLSGVYESVADPTLGLFIVADGMGGHEGGEVASKLAVQIIADRLIQSVLLRRFTGEEQPLGEAVRAHVTDAISEANEQVRRLAQERANDMGCTLTLALVMDGKAYVANVGDSRTYVYNQEGLKQITTDHSVVASLIAAGMAEPEELYTHPDRHVIYRALGTKPTIEVDIWEEGLVPGDTLLSCCDGLWESIRDEGIQDVLLTQFDPQAACDEMVRLANQAGGEDNISVIMVKVSATAKPSLPSSKL
jgi:serine/threonine protein phosphatase PrpC